MRIKSGWVWRGAAYVQGLERAQHTVRTGEETRSQWPRREDKEHTEDRGCSIWDFPNHLNFTENIILSVCCRS